MKGIIIVVGSLVALVGIVLARHLKRSESAEERAHRKLNEDLADELYKQFYGD